MFAGEMQLGEELIDIALEFQGNSVRLRHADTVIGSWPRDETGFVRLSSDHYRVTADGDSISFHPYTASQFGQFLSGETPEITGVPGEGNGSELVADDQSQATGQNGYVPQPDHSERASEVPLWDSLDEDAVEQELPLDVGDESGSIRPDSIHGPNPARPVYPPTEPEPVRFSSPPPPAPIPDHADHHPWQHSANGGPAESSTGSTPPGPAEQLLPSALAPVPGPSGRTETYPPAPEPTETAHPEATPDEGEIAALPLDPEPDLPGPNHYPAPAEDEDEAGVVPMEMAPATPVEPAPSEPIKEDSLAAAAVALLERIRDRITWIRSFVRPSEDPVVPPEHTSDDARAPSDDAENLRQWAMISVVGLAAMGLLAALVWGAISLFGGTGATATIPTTIPTTPSSVANAIDRTPATTAAPSVGPPSTTVPQNQPSFIEQWNKLASAYAYNLAIDAGSEPVSTDLTANIHLSFDSDRVLTLDMTPVGNGSDRDILVAMGMAVAWAEPDLSPPARKDLLGSLGIDIDHPRLSDIGGELSRAGHTYRASVIDGIIRFQVSPAA
ncbi:MAG: hypothetical protein WB239_18475 [Acidimicrobiia bacterium]